MSLLTLHHKSYLLVLMLLLFLLSACNQQQCTDDCIEGAKRCSGNGVQVCEMGGEGCFIWNTPVGCPTGQVCSNGICAGSCSDECSVDNAKRCSGNGVQTCGDHNGDGCMEWGVVTDCPAGQTCSNGDCSVSCTNECESGARVCSGTIGYIECGNYDTDSCLDWGPEVQCPDGQTCSAGHCTDRACTDHCSTFGQKRCSGSAEGYQTCITGSNGCKIWSEEVLCGPNKACTGDGLCSAVCACDVARGICNVALPGSATSCSCDPDCDGAVACNAEDNYCDPECPQGTDQNCNCPCDEAHFCEASAHGTDATCECDPNCEPHESACKRDMVCDPKCPAGVDPDCPNNECSAGWVLVGYRFGNQGHYYQGQYTTENSACRESNDCVNLGDGYMGLEVGEAVYEVKLSSLHKDCIQQIRVDVYGKEYSYWGYTQIYLWNWSTYSWSLLPNRVGGSYSLVGNYEIDEDAHMGCNNYTQTCAIFVKVVADENAEAEVTDVWVYVYVQE